MGNALFIIWRESAEAMLVVGILYAWLRKHPDVKRGMRYLWAGVGAGIALALALAALMLGIARTLSDQGLEYFQTAMMLIAAGLIVQMVFWMRRHGRTFKRELEHDMQKNASAANWWGMLIVVALAVGRESAEAVVFLYGLGTQYASFWGFIGILVLGLGAALATFWVLQQGGKIVSWRAFFRFSEILLLLLAGALALVGFHVARFTRSCWTLDGARAAIEAHIKSRHVRRMARVMKAADREMMAARTDVRITALDCGPSVLGGMSCRARYVVNGQSAGIEGGDHYFRIGFSLLSGWETPSVAETSRLRYSLAPGRCSLTSDGR